MTTTTEYFGGCPECGKSDGYVNVGRSHWFFCAAHQTMWLIGSNLFSSWRFETEEEQRRIWNQYGMDEYTRVNPIDLGQETAP